MGLNEAIQALNAIVGKNALWTQEDVAAYLKVTSRKVRDYQALPKFPHAIRLPSENGFGHPRYKADEVMAWAEGYKEKN